MKRATLLISSLALLSFTQQTFGITLDQDEVTVIIEGSADISQEKDSLRSNPSISEPFVIAPTVPDNDEIADVPNKISTNEHKISDIPFPIENDQAIPTSVIHKQQQKHKEEKEEKQPIVSDFPSGEVVILNQENQWLSNSDSSKHSYLGNWMGVTSQSINR